MKRTVVNTVPYELIYSLSLAVTDNIITSNIGSSSNGNYPIKKSSGIGKSSSVSKTPAPSSCYKNGIVLLDPKDAIVNSWYLKKKRGYVY